MLDLPINDIPSEDDILIMRKALRDCLPPSENSSAGDKQNKQRSTTDNTGLNRSLSNLLSTMDQKYIFDFSACLYVLPVLDLGQAKLWDGSSYSVLIVCDNDSKKRATHQQVADRVGLLNTNAAAATNEDIASALELLSSTMKFLPMLSRICHLHLPSYWENSRRS